MKSHTVVPHRQLWLKVSFVNLNAHITKTALVTLDVVMQCTVGGTISAGIKSVLVEIANQQDVYLSWHQGEQKIEVVARKILDLIDKSWS